MVFLAVYVKVFLSRLAFLSPLKKKNYKKIKQQPRYGRPWLNVLGGLDMTSLDWTTSAASIWPALIERLDMASFDMDGLFKYFKYPSRPERAWTKSKRAWIKSTFYQSCWPTRGHIGRSTGISNPAWHLPQVVPRVVQITGSVHPQPTLPNC